MYQRNNETFMNMNACVVTFSVVVVVFLLIHHPPQSYLNQSTNKLKNKLIQFNNNFVFFFSRLDFMRQNHKNPKGKIEIKI